MACFNPGSSVDLYYQCSQRALYCAPLLPSSGCGPTGATGPAGPPTTFFQAQLSQANGTIPVSTSGTLSPILFNAIRSGNTTGAFNVSTGAFTSPAAGYYIFTVGVVVLQTAATAAAVSVGLLVNGAATNIVAQSVPAIVGQPASAFISSLLKLSAGDTVQVGATTAGALVYGSSLAPAAAYTTFQGVSLV